MVHAKRIYILMIKVNKLFSFFLLRCFLKELENMFSVFLLSYRNTRESLGELEKAVETLICGSRSHSISLSPKLPLVFLGTSFLFLKCELGLVQISKILNFLVLFTTTTFALQVLFIGQEKRPRSLPNICHCYQLGI